MYGQVFEYVILDIHQRDRAENIGTRVGTVVRQDHRALVVTLERDGVHRRLSNVVFIESEIGVGARTEMEGHRTAQSAIVQRHFRRSQVCKIRVGTTDGIVTAHQAVASVW